MVSYFIFGESQFLPLYYEVNITCFAYLSGVLRRSNERMSVKMFPNGDVTPEAISWSVPRNGLSFGSVEITVLQYLQTHSGVLALSSEMLERLGFVYEVQRPIAGTGLSNWFHCSGLNSVAPKFILT